jgi:glyoxylase-like metal-dependent hydrolase (beta-lactamase superfamily II)
MNAHRLPISINRRDLLRGGLIAAGSVVLAPFDFAAVAQQAAAPPTDPVAAARAGMAAAPIQIQRLTDTLTMLSGPGGNVVVLNGRDGKIVVDTFIQGAWDKLKQSLDGMGTAPVKAAIDTHWHFDHADNNAEFRKIGAAVIAHENTPKRMSQTHELKALGMTFPPSPPEALPTQTFKDTHTIDANGDQITLGYIPPAHTDTDITVRFAKANVLHMGDLFFNGTYPFIDASTRGNINGMIGSAGRALQMADDRTKIVPGHGPLGDRAALQKYRTMLLSIRDRVRAEKVKGSTLEMVQAAKPTAEFDAEWGKGMMGANDFVALVYNTLEAPR